MAPAHSIPFIRAKTLEHTEEEWTSFAPLILRYYVDQALPLVKVMRLMKERHGFSATFVWHYKSLLVDTGN